MGGSSWGSVLLYLIRRVIWLEQCSLRNALSPKAWINHRTSSRTYTASTHSSRARIRATPLCDSSSPRVAPHRARDAAAKRGARRPTRFPSRANVASRTRAPRVVYVSTLYNLIVCFLRRKWRSSVANIDHGVSIDRASGFGAHNFQFHAISRSRTTVIPVTASRPCILLTTLASPTNPLALFLFRWRTPGSFVRGHRSEINR